MKRLFRRLWALAILGPGIAWTYLLWLLIGKKKAIRLSGPLFTLATKPFARNWVPRMTDATDFSEFSPRMTKKFWLWGIFFDFCVVRDTGDVFEMNIRYCPICDVMKMMRLPEMTQFVCDADWQVARENIRHWTFRRKFQLSTGDPFCDHTYLRRVEESSDTPPGGG